MKKTLLATATAALLLSACGQTPNLKGEISGVESDTLLIYRSDMVTGKWMGVDTVALSNGHFETDIPDSVLLEISLVSKNKYGEMKPQVIGQSFFFFPGDHMELEGELPYNVNAHGTELYDLLGKDKNYTKKTAELNQIMHQMELLEENGNNTDSLATVYDEKERQVGEASLSFIKAHPDSRAAAYLSLQMEGSEGVEAIAHLSDAVRKGEMAALIAEYDKYYKTAVETEKNKAFINPGVMAPEFQLADMAGKTKSLADFHGKYAILDFWGTWCGWCLEGIPAMKKYYEKYKDKVEFIGICCNDQEERWRKCVKKRKMEWTNLFDSDNTTSTTYGIDGYPTKIILDKEGKIEQIFEGESQEFYDYIDALFK